MKRLALHVVSFALAVPCLAIGQTQTAPPVTPAIGTMVIKPQFDAVDSFSDGLAAIRLDDEKTGKWGFIDTTGKMVVTPQFDWVYMFSEGLAGVRVGDKKTGKWGFVSR